MGGLCRNRNPGGVFHSCQRAGQESAYSTYPPAVLNSAPAGPRLKTQSQEQRGPLRLDFIATHTHRRGRDSKIGQPVEEEEELSSS